MNIELVEKSDAFIVISPYATIWISGIYYILAKLEAEEELTHYKIDYLKDLVILERNVNMIFGGINSNQYAERFIFQNGEDLERYDIECNINLRKTLVEVFGPNMTVIKSDNDKILVKIKCIPSVMREWVMAHSAQCEVVAPKHFRDEIQMAVMETYKNILGMKGLL